MTETYFRIRRWSLRSIMKVKNARLARSNRAFPGAMQALVSYSELGSWLVIHA